MSDLFCGRIAAGEKYNLTRDSLLSYRFATSFMEDELRLALDNKGVYLEIY